MTDNVAVLAGYTFEVEAYSTSKTPDKVLLVKPGTNLRQGFRAWDMGAQEFIAVEGWRYRFRTAALHLPDQ